MGTVKNVAARVRDSSTVDLRRRVKALEDEVQEARALNVRIAELTDLVAELLVPLARRDEERVAELLAKYQASI